MSREDLGIGASANAWKPRTGPVAPRRLPLVALVPVLATFSLSALNAAAQAEDGAAAPTSRSPLDVRGALEASQVDSGTNVSFALTLTNVSSQVLQDVRVAHIGGADVNLKSATWCGGVTWETLRGCVISKSLSPRQSVTVYGALETPKPVRSNVSAVIDWTIPAEAKASATANSVSVDETRSTATFPVGALLVESAGLRRAGLISAWLASLAIPIVGGAFALWWKLTEQKRAQRRTEREDAIHLLERERDEKAEAWRLMLPVSHDFAIKYYSPFVEAARSVVHSIHAWRAQAVDVTEVDKTAALNASLYSWVMLHVRREALVKTGAYYFKNHTGELLVVALYRAYSFAFVSKASLESRPAPTQEREAIRRLLVRVARDTDLDETPDRFLKRLSDDQKYGGDLKHLWNWFRDRLSSAEYLDDAMAYLDVFSAVLFFEMNRPYAPWFDEDQAGLSVTKDQIGCMRKAVILLSAWDQQLVPVKEKLDEYLAGAAVKKPSLLPQPQRQGLSEVRTRRRRD